MKWTVRRGVAIIIFIFVVLALASVASGNDLGFGLDYFPTTPPPFGMGIVQGLAYISLLGSVGLLWFRGFVVGEIDERSNRLSIILTIVTVVLHVVLISFIRVWEEGGDTASLLNPANWQVSPRASSIRALMALAIGLPIQHWFAISDVSIARNRWLMLVGSLIALGSLTVVGHTANLPPTWLTHGADFVHGVGAAFWFGGMLGLVLYLKGAFADRVDVARTGEVMSRFSSYALYCVVALALSGAAMSVAVKDNPLDFTGTAFARVLSLKLIIVIIPIALAAYNRFSLMPQLRREKDTDRAWSKLRRSTQVEVSLLTVILLITGFLVLQSPVA